MPILDKLFSEFKDQGLIVLGLNAGEDRETVENFLKTAKVAYPLALTNDTNLVPAYEVSAFPTYVLVDRAANIAGYQVGSEGEEALREMLKKADLKRAPPKAQ
jgi:predicted DsbA family dithiol-disulfide isomerase